MNNLQNLGDRLQYIRKKSGISQEELASLSSVSQGLISKIERGDQDKTSEIIPLSLVLKCSPYWLFDGTGNPFETEVVYSQIENKTSKQEQQLLVTYRNLSTKNQKLALKLVSILE